MVEKKKALFRLGILVLIGLGVLTVIEVFLQGLNIETQPALVHNLGLAFLNSGSLDNAKQCFQDRVDLAPDSAFFAHLYLGCIDGRIVPKEESGRVDM